MKRISKICLLIFLLMISVFFFNEYLVYYLAFSRCSWPAIGRTNIMIIADTHLLGVYRGHWFDKLRREWPMHQYFQSIVSKFQPEAVFFLGDLFDEGLLGNDHIFSSYVDRFNQLFKTEGNVKRYVVMGNHDVGFHHEIFPQRLLRFTKGFGVPRTVEHVELGGNIFVLLNSMAMEGDYCYLCANAVNEIERFSRMLNCTQDLNTEKCTERLHVPYSRPIVMQHFPLYRRSDMACDDTEDQAPPNIREHRFKPKHDCVSESSTRLIIEKLRPRVVFGGHTHHGCRKWWKAPDSFWEYTVPSFSWRNNRRPSFLLVSVLPEAFDVSTCFIPDEYLVIMIYVVALLICLTLIGLELFIIRRPFMFRRLVSNKENVE